MDVERSLPLELEDHAAAVSCLLERFSREQDSVVRAKLASLLGQLGKSPLLKATDLADSIVRMLKTESTASLCDYCSYLKDSLQCSDTVGWAPGTASGL